VGKISSIMIIISQAPFLKYLEVKEVIEKETQVQKSINFIQEKLEYVRNAWPTIRAIANKQPVGQIKALQ